VPLGRRVAPSPGVGTWLAALDAESRRQLGRALGLLGAVIVAGTVGYIALGMPVVDALYQTVTTVSTVGFRELDEDPSLAWRLFTMVVVLAGVGTALYSFGLLIESLVEGGLQESLGRRRMERQIRSLTGHVIVCGWGRVGRRVAEHIAGAGQEVVVVERDPDRYATIAHLKVAGDATDDAVLRDAGIERAACLVAALDTDADNLYVTLSGRSLRPDLFIVARARIQSAEPKLMQAGANRVVNPQQIGGARMAAMALQPVVADFLDVVMHDGSLEFRLGEVPLTDGSPLVGKSLRDAAVRERTGALVLALRTADGEFQTNPGPAFTLAGGQVIVAIGTESQLDDLGKLARG
jgi:voltage-gated potassium channel